MYIGRVYMITNKINNLIYVGETTQSLKGRMRIHKQRAFDNPKTPLHKDMSKYGMGSFIIEELEKIEGEDKHTLKLELRHREYEWIVKLNTLDSNIGYNQFALDGDKYLTNDEYRLKQIDQGKYATQRINREQFREWGRSMKDSEGWKNYITSGKAKSNYIPNCKARIEGLQKALNKKVSQYTKEGVYIATYPSISQASIEVGVSVDAISKSINGKTKRPHKYIWMLETTN